MEIRVEEFPGLGYVVHIVRISNGRRHYIFADNLETVHRFCDRIGVTPVLHLQPIAVPTPAGASIDDTEEWKDGRR